ncbi:Bug family tripartite tricarboxylate transporter substrate binding protein [Frigidibacter sp. ROC022]|uniref:Bug family tripartite tricarboxylate transporter substrate binding protein n=1 Tax=Frigidibacter sp. ROC022 TaxID=2971796 RepID=UPI00215A7914|nr:tripartite tricarboxylate transporter substrate binding protein [Frigidibacter sp. ROC022]MCR8724659.1 tripartite tricarboxylate transporter substrate binding protein [Frigidibacter sp. ROC022]
MKLLKLARSLAVAATAFAAASPAMAEFPERDITIVMPFPPGGGTDLVIREIAKQIQNMGGPTLIVDNRPGAGGTIAAMYAKDAEPDGYTIFFGNASTHAINPYIMSVPYDPVADFVPVLDLMSFPHVLLVPTSSGIETLDQLIELAKTKEGGLSFATQGLGSGGQLLGEQLRISTGTNMVAIPFQGGGPALLETSTGRTDFMFNGFGPARSFVEDGELRPIAVTGPDRLPQLPDVPTMAELGHPDVNAEFWFGVFAPAGTPDDVVEKLHEIFAKAVDTEGVSNVMASMAATVSLGTGKELGARVESDLKKMKALTEAIGIAK